MSDSSRGAALPTLDEIIEEYKTSLEEISEDPMMSDGWKDEEREEARRQIKRKTKHLMQELIKSVTTGMYDGSEVQDAVDGVEEDFIKKVRQL